MSGVDVNGADPVANSMAPAAGVSSATGQDPAANGAAPSAGSPVSTGQDPAAVPLAPEAAAWVERLQLEPLEHEGGLYRQTYLDEHSSAILYLLADPDFSALHSLDGVEVYHWYAGSALHLLLLHPDGRIEEPVLGPDAAAGEQPQIVVPAGVMQGSSPAGDWCLIGTTMAPAFNWEGFVLGERAALTAEYPTVASRIAALTR